MRRSNAHLSSWWRASLVVRRPVMREGHRGRMAGEAARCSWPRRAPLRSRRRSCGSRSATPRAARSWWTTGRKPPSSGAAARCRWACARGGRGASRRTTSWTSRRGRASIRPLAGSFASGEAALAIGRTRAGLQRTACLWLGPTVAHPSRQSSWYSSEEPRLGDGTRAGARRIAEEARAARWRAQLAQTSAEAQQRASAAGGGAARSMRDAIVERTAATWTRRARRARG